MAAWASTNLALHTSALSVAHRLPLELRIVAQRRATLKSTMQQVRLNVCRSQETG